MKDPKALFPILFASSWLGNLLLTVLAFYLAFTHEGPLTPLLFATVALCILSGNILPICVYAITIKFRRIELEAESTEVSWRVQEGLKRSEDVMNRLDEAEGALAKSVLVARQVPERIREALEDVQLLTEKINTLEIGTFSEAIDGQSESLDSVRRSIEDLSKVLKTAEADLSVIGKDVKNISHAQTKVIESMTDKSKGRKKEDMDVSIAERLDLVFETLETIQDSLDALLQRIAGSQVDEPFGESEPDDEEQEIEDWADEDEDVEEADTDVVDDAAEDEDQPDPIEEEEPEAEPDEKSDDDAESDSAPDLGIETEEEPFVLSDGRTRLIAHAMIGMHNKLYIRGDHPWLSWEDGQQMELIGIGEFSWSIDNIKESIEVTVLLNDEYAAEQGTFVLHPGKTLRVNPTFPKA